MASSRAAVRSLRAIHPRPSPFIPRNTISRPLRRSYADAPAASGSGSAVVGGIAGGLLVFLAAFGYYHVSGARKAVNSIHATKSYFDSGVKKLQDSAPEPNEALQWLRETALSYSAIIPGAKGYVNTAFDDLDAVRNKHGEEVDKIVKETYVEVKGAMKSGVSLETASKVWSILEKRLKDISSLAGDAAEDVMNNHPEIKNKLGGNFNQLKELGDKFGPEAKKQVDETWSQISSIAAKGLSVSSIPEIKKLIEEKVQQLNKLGDEAWKKGLEQAKPYLDKSPKIKELIENNVDALKSGNYGELFEKVKSAASSGDLADLQKYVDQAKEKGKDAGKSLGVNVDSYLDMIPGLGEVGGQIKQLQEIGQKHGKEAQDLLKSTMDEVKSVLEKKVGEAQKIADKAKKETKE